MRWGVFEGSVNGVNLSILNDRDPYCLKEIACIKSGVSKPGMSCDSTNILTVSMRLDSIHGLEFAITDFSQNDKWLLTNPYPFEIKTEYVCGLRYNSDIRDWHKVWIPRESNPFKIELIEQKWYSSFDVRSELNLEGVLYNRNNPTDSIVIKGYLGVR